MNQKLPIHKYRRIRNEPTQKMEENLIRLKARPRAFVYAAYAGKLLFEEKHDVVFLNATGPATFKVIQTVEFLRRRVKGLHVAYNIETTTFEDKYEPKEEGLDNVVVNRSVPTITATLTIKKGDDIKSYRGYMPPLAEEKLLDEKRFRDEITEHFNKPRGEKDGEDREVRGRRGFRGDRGRRGGRGRFNQSVRRESENGDRPPRRGRDEREDNRRPPRGDMYDGRRPPRDDMYDDRRPPRGDMYDDRRPPRRGVSGDRRPPRRGRDDRHDNRDYGRPRRDEDRDYRMPNRGRRFNDDDRRGPREDRYDIPDNRDYRSRRSEYGYDNERRGSYRNNFRGNSRGDRYRDGNSRRY